MIYYKATTKKSTSVLKTRTYETAWCTSSCKDLLNYAAVCADTSSHGSKHCDCFVKCPIQHIGALRHSIKVYTVATYSFKTGKADSISTACLARSLEIKHGHLQSLHTKWQMSKFFCQICAFDSLHWIKLVSEVHTG